MRPKIDETPMFIAPWWDGFLDKSIQAILKKRRREPQDCDANPALLAWPVIAFRIARDVACDREACVFHAGESFMVAYSHDPDFMSALLFAATRYANAPFSEWSFKRAVCWCWHSRTGQKLDLRRRFNSRLAQQPYKQKPQLAIDIREALHAQFPQFKSKSDNSINKEQSQLRKELQDTHSFWKQAIDAAESFSPYSPDMIQNLSLRFNSSPNFLKEFPLLK